MHVSSSCLFSCFTAILSFEVKPFLRLCVFARKWFFFLCAILLCCAVPAAASTYLDINDDAYALLARLEAEGVINSGLLTSKPISRKEAVRLYHEAEKNSEGRSAFIRSLVQDLKQRIRPEEFEAGSLKLLDTVYAKYVNTNADVRTLTYPPFGTQEKEQALNHNNDGDLYERGSNGRIGFTSRVEDAARFSFFLNPEFRAAQSDGSQLIIKQGYAVFDFGWDLIAGKEAQWWGPGYHGAILLTNNAEPFTLVKISNPHPVILPWIFKYLGPFDFTWFVTELERDRADVAAPYLWGMRLNFKPHPILEIGLERTALLGGRGRPTTAATWLDQLIGKNDHFVNDPTQDTGDQRAGYDLKLSLPFDVQPLQVYMEADGEDSYHGFLPRYWAYLYGLYLPRVLSLERLEFRLEWARTFDKRADKPTTWYLNGIYTSGYTYHGLIIGHHMGTDSQDAFTELTYRFPEKSARVSLAFDRTEHSKSQEIHERERDISLHGALALTDDLDLDLVYGYAWIDNKENIPGIGWEGQAVQGTITRRF